MTNSILCMVVSEGKPPIPSTLSTTAEAEEDPSRLHAVSPNLGGYTQWVRWRTPTGKKLRQVQTSTPTRKNPLDDSASHPEARRPLPGEIPPGIPKSPIRCNWRRSTAPVDYAPADYTRSA